MKKKTVIGILAHVDAGKTTLAEAMLYHAGKLKKLGRVDHRDSFLDTHNLERQRGITIFSKQALFELPDLLVTLLDTPGLSADPGLCCAGDQRNGWNPGAYGDLVALAPRIPGPCFCVCHETGSAR